VPFSKWDPVGCRRVGAFLVLVTESLSIDSAIARNVSESIDRENGLGDIRQDGLDVVGVVNPMCIFNNPEKRREREHSGIWWNDRS
jgi:hypothetical protein